MKKLAEGGFNKVFRLVMDNDSVVIARIPNPNAGPPFLTTASEVATMDFASTVLGIPVPKVLSWSAEAHNPVQSEYILMEEAAGTQLGKMWSAMDLEAKLAVGREVVAVEEKLLSLSFTKHGNLFFFDDVFPGCSAAEVIGEVSHAVKSDVQRRFVVGPVIDRHFWDGERTSMAVDRGPWDRARDYLRAISRREIAWLSHHAAPQSPRGLLPTKSEAQSDPEAHIELYRKFESVVDQLLPSDEKLIRSALWHWDMHASNIFVEKDRVSAIIDWQDAWAGPLFVQARHPALVDYDGEVILRLPEHYEGIKDADEKARVRSQVERSIVLHAYESDTRKTNPILHEVYHLPLGRNRKDTINFSGNTWDGDIIPFRQCLIRVARHWSEMCPDEPCPFSFSEEEISAHMRDGEGWNETADFWDSLASLVDRDGWTSNEDFENAFELFAQLRDEGLKVLTGTERTEFEEQTKWATRKPHAFE